jgi:hypothetical protein
LSRDLDLSLSRDLDLLLSRDLDLSLSRDLDFFLSRDLDLFLSRDLDLDLDNEACLVCGNIGMMGGAPFPLEVMKKESKTLCFSGASPWRESYSSNNCSNNVYFHDKALNIILFVTNK